MVGDASDKRRLPANVDNLEGVGPRLGFELTNPIATNGVRRGIAVSRFRIDKTEFRIATG